MIFSEYKYISTFIAIEDNGETLDYREINSLKDEFVSFQRGKELVFCLCENSIASLAGYISCLCAGMVPVLLDACKDVTLIKNLIGIYRPFYIWMPNKLEQLFENTQKVCCFRSYIFVKTEFPNQTIYNDLALLLTTSGTTGSPKLVRLSYNNLLSNTHSIAEYLNITNKERPIMSLPMYYSYGLSVINSHLIKGATILMTDKPVVQKEFWTFAKEQGATSIAGVPYTYEILKRLRFFRMNLPELKTMTQAGGKLNANLAKEYIEEARNAGKRFIVMYGQTEATARMSYLPPEKALEKYASIGVPIPGGKFILTDDNGHEIIEVDRDGELVYFGSNVSMGYAECREDLSKGDENNGILHTGDIARRDSDGFYYITGRMKRFVKIFGNRVNLDILEQFLKVVTSSCACVGTDEKITVFVTETGKEEEIKSFLIKKTGLYVRAFDVRIIDDIPKNSSGKIQYTQLTQLLD
ncbi:Long-chain-fatty-acid--CoA ligase [termite gut metagenome]|uniref:Long-chain-fatty-acid--CoA ligase n=1 Tax=termite gut metagenome TaxID=433724 RepID=A0A5J4QNX9_9ZZZZ